MVKEMGKYYVGVVPSTIFHFIDVDFSPKFIVDESAFFFLRSRLFAVCALVQRQLSI